MQITLKKTLIAGVGILAALFFFLIAIVPVSRTVLGGTWSGSIMGVLSGDKTSLLMVETQIDVKSLKDLAQWKEAVDALIAVYKTFAIMAIVLFVLSLLACTGAFFMKKPRGARLLAIPFLVLDIVFSLVVMIFAILLAGSTSLANEGSSISVGGPVLMWVIGLVLFIGMLISSGVVKEVVFVGKKEK